MDHPMSVEQIVQEAGEPFFDPHFPLQQWLRTLALMQKQAKIYEREGNLQMAYLLLYRHARLVLESLPKHPQIHDAKYKHALQDARESVQVNLTKLEVLKPRINSRNVEARGRGLGTKQVASTTKSDADYAKVSNQETPGLHLSASLDKVDPGIHSDLAVKHANREVRRRIANAGTDSSLSGENHDDEFDGIRESIRRARRHLDHRPSPRGSTSVNTIGSMSPSYPLVPNQQKTSTDLAQTRQSHSSMDYSISSSVEHHRPALPPLPPKETQDNLRFPSPPPLPEKIFHAGHPAPFEVTPSPSPEPPSFDLFSTPSTLENGTPLRTVFLPSKLRHQFVQIAASNTRLNLETCGILCGTLIRNALFITRLVIPEQTSTSDTCEMINEEALYEYCEAQPEEIMVLGWIHTHPTQTCFLSSRDCHTHCWYQLSLPESIAIVCSPFKSPDWGVFRLSDPPGMRTVRNCEQIGIFHPHAESDIYVDALGRPGHVIEHPDLLFQLVDLRP